MIKISRIFPRIWYYFRAGNAIYVALFLSLLSNIIIIYQLYLKNTWLAEIFPNMNIFAVVFTTGYITVCIIAGIIHKKWFLEADMEIATSKTPQIVLILKNQEEIKRKLEELKK